MELGRKIEALERPKAKQRQKAGGGKPGSGKLPEPTPQVRDKVGKALGVSGKKNNASGKFPEASGDSFSGCTGSGAGSGSALGGAGATRGLISPFFSSALRILATNAGFVFVPAATSSSLRAASALSAAPTRSALSTFVRLRPSPLRPRLEVRGAGEFVPVPNSPV